jgi:RNA polymerase sigma-70 factor (ECF subfamily)
MLEFSDLYETYAPEVFRFAYWLAGDRAEAEDITSETFVRAWVKLDAIRTETLKAYLMAIARNLYLEQRRKRSPQGALDDSVADPAPGPEQSAEDRSELATAYRLLQTLSEVDRAAFILRVQQELPYAEIARVLQVSLAAVKVKVHRVRLKLLAARLGPEEHDDGS